MAALTPHRRALRAATGLLLAAAAQYASGASGASGVSGGGLPPGLYQIDSEGTSSHSGNLYSTDSRRDGANGDSVSRSRIGNRVGPQLAYKGSAPVTRCISRANQWYMPEDSPSKCTSQATRRVGDASEYTAICPTGTVKVTLRRLDEARWEEISEIEMGSATTSPNLMSIKPTLQFAASEAKTPAERAAARKQLAELTSLQRQTVDKRAEMVELFAAAMRKATDAVERESLRKAIAALGGTEQMSARTRRVLTRIAGSCTVAPPN